MNKNYKNIKKEINSIPPIVFTPFKKNRNYSALLMYLSMSLSIFIFIRVILGDIAFTQEQLRTLCEFTLNTVFVIAALVVGIFALSISDNHPEKEKVVFSYIGQISTIASVVIFSYILSYCDFFNIKLWREITVFSLYFCCILIFLSGCVIRLLSSVVAYFNIRD